jgi:polyferredoxin
MGPFLTWKLVRGNLAPFYQSYVELAAFLTVILLAAAAMLVRRRRQLWRRVVQATSLAVFFFVVSSCLGVFGLIRNAYFGLTWPGKDDLRAFYYLGMTVVVVGLSFHFGPVFCGWICPTGTLQEWVGTLRTGLRARNREVVRKAAAAVIGAAALVAFLVGTERVFRARRPMLEDSAVLWASALGVIALLAMVRPASDRALKVVRYVSLVLVLGFCIAGVTVTSPVHFVFSNVHDWASLLSTLVIMGAALFVSRAWCRYLCPFGVILCAVGKQALARVERRPGCTRCNECASVCTTGAVDRGEIDRMACTMCLACVDGCPEHVLVMREPAARPAEVAEHA